MRAVVQRVKECSVSVDGKVVGSIGAGLLVYLGVGKKDTDKDLRSLCEKIMGLRIFTDSEGKMNLSVRDVGESILVVSQFTLYGDAREGRRPSYTEAAEAVKARAFYENAIGIFRHAGVTVSSGEFQASMEVTYTNRGPVTILLDSEKRF
jgi:D-aminoacyl-tRNA deacylase